MDNTEFRQFTFNANANITVIDEEKIQDLFFFRQGMLDDKKHPIHYYHLDEEFDAIRSIN